MMTCTRRRLLLLVITLCVSFVAWGQGVGSQAGRGGGRGGGAGTGDFYTYDTTATAGITIPDGPPTEAHQKIILNGEAFATPREWASCPSATRHRDSRKRICF